MLAPSDPGTQQLQCQLLCCYAENSALEGKKKKTAISFKQLEETAISTKLSKDVEEKSRKGKRESWSQTLEAVMSETITEISGLRNMYFAMSGTSIQPTSVNKSIEVMLEFFTTPTPNTRKNADSHTGHKPLGYRVCTMPILVMYSKNSYSRITEQPYL
ncbi:hypothetical protein E5288_WYG003719 [Bos mutus]|uniref:Uncharacterized protein n=1 Tax=Bos mutus TaxID=72004 RepID=A0A6B0RF19_9CETA|nr:hypothetical protein [Bos mutus]